MSDAKGRNEERQGKRKVLVGPTRQTNVSISVDAYSLASQRRAIAYGRARGRS